MDKLFKGFLLFTAALLFISNTKGMDKCEEGEEGEWFKAYHQDPRRTASNPHRTISAPSPQQAFVRQSQQPEDTQGGFRRNRLSSDNLEPDQDQPIESLLAVLSEIPSSASSGSSGKPITTESPVSPSPQRDATPKLSAPPPPEPLKESTTKLSAPPSPQPLREATPKLPASPLLQFFRETSSPASAPDVSRVASQSELLTRSLSSLSLASGSGSPIIVRASEDLPLPRSLFISLERNALSEEFLKDPRYKHLSKVVTKKDTVVVEPALLNWLRETQAFWAKFNDLSAKLGYAAQRLKVKQEAASGDVDLDDSLLGSPAPASTGVLGTSLLSEYHMTPEQKRAASIERGKKKLEAADAAFKAVVAEAKRRHPTLSHDELIKRLACGMLAQAKVGVLYGPYQKDPSDFPSPQRFLAFLLDPLDLRITLTRLPIKIRSLEAENEALEFLLSVYKRELLNRVGSWAQVSSWKDWYNLKGNDGPLNVIKRLLRQAYPFASLARYKRDLSTTKGMALAALHRDALGLVLWEACLHKIIRISATDNPAQAPSPEIEQVLNDQYKLLPKHFNSDGSPESFLSYASTAPSFQVVYEGIDMKIPDEDALRGLPQTFYQIVQRKYTNLAGKESVYIPMKDPLTEKKNDKTGDEYHVLTAALRTSKDTVATVTPSEVLIPNPLVEGWNRMPRKFANMVREFRTYAFMSFHRGLWIKVLQEAHAKQKPILTGCGEGLIRPNEPKPIDDPVRHDYDFTQIRQKQELTRVFESLLETNRNLRNQLHASPGWLSSLPLAAEFIVLTKPERPYTEGEASSKSSEHFESLRLDGLGIYDEELQAKCRTPDGLKGIFHKVQELTLVSNNLVSPMPGIDFRFLTALDVSRNKLTNLNFLNGLWGQLVTLHASNNHIRELPPLNQVGYYNPTLLHLNISSNPLTSLDSIGALTLLKELDISNCNVGSLTKLTPLVYLESLTANGCGLNGLWESVLVTAPLERLETLSLEGNSRLNLFPYRTQKVVSSDIVAKNNAKYNEKFPRLKVFREQRELRATPVRPITLSDLIGIIDSPQA